MNELTEWNHIGWPPARSSALVYLSDHSVRRVLNDVDNGSIRFTDCTYPEQNVVCDRDQVLAWRSLP